MKRTVGGLAALAMISSAAAYAQSCNPYGRIDAQCYPDLQTATAAALAANQPLWLPAGSPPSGEVGAGSAGERPANTCYPICYRTR